MIADPAIRGDLAPHGHIRVAINLGNPALAVSVGAANELQGIAIDLSRALAYESGLAVDFVTYRSAGKVIDAAKSDAWDVAFLAIDQQRAAQLAFTPPYMRLEGRFVVRSDSRARDLEGLDTADARIAVSVGSAYESYLNQHLKAARLLRYATPTESLEAFLSLGLEAAAGVSAVLQRFAKATPGVRVLDTAFMAIEQGIAIPLARTAGAKYLTAFIGRQMATGRVGC